jgi:hypothetical protein
MSDSSESQSSNDRMRAIIRDYKEHCDVVGMCHELESEKDTHKYNKLHWFSRCLPILGGTLLMPELTIQNTDCPTDVSVFFIAATVLTLLGTLAGVYNDVSDYKKSAILHHNAYLGLSELSRTINFFLAKYHNESELTTFADSTEHTIAVIAESSPSLSFFLIKQVRLDMQDVKKRAKMETHAIKHRAKKNKEKIRVLDTLNTLHIDDLRNIITTVAQESPPSSEIRQALSKPSIISNVSRKRIQQLEEYCHETNRRDLVESILFDCNYSVDEIEAFKKTRSVYNLRDIKLVAKAREDMKALTGVVVVHTDTKGTVRWVEKPATSSLHSSLDMPSSPASLGMPSLHRGYLDHQPPLPSPYRVSRTLQFSRSHPDRPG